MSHRPEPALEEYGNLRRRDGDQHIYDERDGRQTSQQPDEHQRAADYFNHADERGHDLRRRNTDLCEAADAEVGGKQKLLDAFGEKDRAHDETDEDHDAGCARSSYLPPETHADTSCLLCARHLRRGRSCEPGDVGESEAAFDVGDLLDRRLVAVRAELLFFDVLELV